MRIEEGWNLRVDCLSVEDDPMFGHICTLRGVTTKAPVAANRRSQHAGFGPGVGCLPERLATDRYVSPHGAKRKADSVRLIDSADMKKLTKLAKEGRVACREILLGVCTNREPCPYGGIDSIAHCGGGDAAGDVKPCPDVLYDKEKVRQVRALDRHLDERLADAPLDSPLRASIEAQKRSVRNFLHVIEPD